jgi:hypothetical protein
LIGDQDQKFSTRERREKMVAMDSLSMKLLKLPLFDGEHKKYMVWWVCFEAYVGCFGFLEALEEDLDMPLMSKTPIDEATSQPLRTSLKQQLLRRGTRLSWQT